VGFAGRQGVKKLVFGVLKLTKKLKKFRVMNTLKICPY